MGNQASMPDRESSDWKQSEEFRIAVARFHALYAMPPTKPVRCKRLHEIILDDCFEYLGVCSDIKTIGGSYEDVTVVKNETEDDFEFDVMFVLEIPEECRLEVVEIPGRAGYAFIKVISGHRGIKEYLRSTYRTFFARCLTFENDMWIVDAEKTTAAFFDKLRRWIDNKSIPAYKLRPKQHGTAIQMDVICEQLDTNTVIHNKPFYSVDIAPTLEIIQRGGVQRYVTKPEKKRTPDSITWQLLFYPKKGDSDQEQYARKIFRSAISEFHKQLSKYCAWCRGVCNGYCTVPDVLSSTRMPLSRESTLALQKALLERGSRYRLTLVNLQELNASRNQRLVAIQYFFRNELEAMPVPEKSGYAWLKFGERTSASCSRFADAIKLGYLPGRKFLDIKAASDMLVEELQDIASDLFKHQDVIVRRDGPVVRIDVYPERENTMLYHCIDIVLAAYVNGDFYIGLPHDYDDVPDTVAWRRSYSYEETLQIQQAPAGLKKIFRVLKALRNEEPGLAQLTSYHLKTLLLNMQQSKTVAWNESSAKTLICVLKFLKNCLNKRKLQTHFNPEINLLENMTTDCRVHMKCRIDELLRSRKKMLRALKFSTDETT